MGPVDEAMFKMTSILPVYQEGSHLRKPDRTAACCGEGGGDMGEGEGKGNESKELRAGEKVSRCYSLRGHTAFFFFFCNKTLMQMDKG